jgi:hypothetical protein
MFNVVKKSIQWGEETLTLETGKIARKKIGTFFRQFFHRPIGNLRKNGQKKC